MEHKKAKISHAEQQKEKRIQKNEGSISSLWGNFKRSNICILGVPKEEERKQGIENLCEKIMMENFSNLVKEIDIQVQEALSPKEVGPKEAHNKAHHNYITQVKYNKERILKAARKR